jgi:hypothetical protein
MSHRLAFDLQFSLLDFWIRNIKPGHPFLLAWSVAKPKLLVDQGTRKSGCRISGDQSIRKSKKKVLGLIT